MKKILCISIFLFACSTETLPSGEADVSKTDTAPTDDVRVDVSVKNDVSVDISKDLSQSDVSQDVSADAAEDVVDMSARVPRGTCESDVDCKDGTCVTIGDEKTGWKTCAKRIQERTQCDEPGRDQCCKSEECKDGANGVCLSPLPVCTGIRPPSSNLCYYDTCVVDADCAKDDVGVCIPGGAFGEGAATCFYGGCRVDSDCSSGEEGECIPFTEPCAKRHAGFYCVYKDSECRSDEDCTKGMFPYCVPQKTGTTCEEFRPPA